MRLTSAFLLAAAALTGISALHQANPNPVAWRNHCKPFSGDFTIHQYQLYPENADFDFKSCLLYLGFVSPMLPICFCPAPKEIIVNNVRMFKIE
jgi:hypothetical protein